MLQGHVGDQTMPTPLRKTFDPNGEPCHDGIYGLPTEPSDAALVLIPVEWEVTVSYRGGCSQAPRAILAASRQVEVFDEETGSPYRHGIAMLEHDPQINRLHASAVEARCQGKPEQVDRLYTELNAIVAAHTSRWRTHGKTVGVVGGEHGVGLGAIDTLASELGSLGILQVDAHADLRSEYQGCRFSHAAFASNALKIDGLEHIVQVGVRDYCPEEADKLSRDPRITTFFDRDLSRISHEEMLAPLPPDVWISFDIDGLEPSLCPHTGTPVPGGLAWREAMALIGAVARSGRRIVGFDLCEVVPGIGSSPLGSGWDEIVGARLLYKLCGWSLRHRIDNGKKRSR